ncbi:MAG: T9SS type A sorting domain-containing protein [Candidatus Cloacimonetes bacterium]|nr:T9SS type A sorting domain-containing protein [Candidatus Cloacimonadota bacterium]
MTKKMNFKAFLFIAVTILCFSFLHSETIAKAPANFGEQDAGTPLNPYRISGLDNLRWLSEHPDDWWRGFWEGVHFIQTTDIDATETLIWNNGKGFRPIGYYHPNIEPISFCGVYDGGEYSISKLSIYLNETLDGDVNFWVGMFSRVGQSTLKNINLIDVNYNIDTQLEWSVIRIGGLAGSIIDSNIENVYVTGNINSLSPSASPFVGGIVGFIDTTYILYSSFEGEINIVSNTTFTSGYILAGGLAGYGSIQINESFSKGKVYAQATAGSVYIGGIIGNIFYDGIIYNCYSMMDIYSTALAGTSYAAGISGLVQSSRFLIGNCYATGNINGDVSGGITGLLWYSDNGQGESITLSNNFWDIETTGLSVPVGENNGGIITDCFGLPTIQMKQANTYIEYGWDFEIIWEIDGKINEGYPFLKNNKHLISIPFPVTLLTPENDAVEVDLRPVFKWDLPIEGGEIEGLRFYISSIFSFDPNDNTMAGRKIASPTILPADTAEYTLEIDLEHDTTYYWQVITFNDYGDSIDNVIYSFTTKKFVSDIDENTLLLKTELLGNFPNPFNPETIIRFNVAVESIVSIDIYNIRGQRVKNLLDKSYERGSHTLVWDGKDDDGKELGSGVYLYQMIAGDVVETRRMVLLK